MYLCATECSLVLKWRLVFETTIVFNLKYFSPLFELAIHPSSQPASQSPKRIDDEKAQNELLQKRYDREVRITDNKVSEFACASVCCVCVCAGARLFMIKQQSKKQKIRVLLLTNHYVTIFCIKLRGAKSFCDAGWS